MSKSIKSFFKAQVSAFSGGLIDYGLMILLTEVAHIHFSISILISGMLGGLVNFSLNRFWAFKSSNDYCVNGTSQLLRFAVVVIGSISLKSTGTYVLHHSFAINYKLGRLLIDSLVSYGFNYPMMKNWVFKQRVAAVEI